MPLALLVLVAVGYGYQRYQYPYGASHCCDLILYGAFEEYAAAHKGDFPAGQPTPEASFSLLYPTHADAHLLCGKAFTESESKAILESGHSLTPETCSWHYNEGLNVFDSPRIALFWDKTGLGHSGERLSSGGHTVLFVGGERRHVPAVKWDAFVKEQRELLAQRRDKKEVRVDGTLSNGHVHAQLIANRGSLYGRIWKDYRFSYGETVAKIDRDEGGVVVPIIPMEDLKLAKAETDGHQIRFVLKDQQIVCNGSRFWFERTAK